MFDKLNRKLANFMIGRYGSDEFGKFLTIVALITMIISMWIGSLFLPSILIYAYTTFRMFSKNHYKRRFENDKYIQLRYRLKERFSSKRNYRTKNSYTTADAKKKQDKRTHRIYKCPNCGQKIRVPKNKGKISIKCPKCRIEFTKKT